MHHNSLVGTKTQNIDGTWRQGFIVNSCIIYHCNVWRIQRKLSKKPCRQVLSLFATKCLTQTSQDFRNLKSDRRESRVPFNSDFILSKCNCSPDIQDKRQAKHIARRQITLGVVGSHFEEGTRNACLVLIWSGLVRTFSYYLRKGEQLNERGKLSNLAELVFTDQAILVHAVIRQAKTFSRTYQKRIKGG